MAKNADSKSNSKNSGDYFKTMVHFKDDKSAREFIETYDFFLVDKHRPGKSSSEKPGSEKPSPKKSREVILELFLTKAHFSTVNKLGLEHEIKENMSKIGRERQKEVGKGDRFKGGEIAPKSKNLSSKGGQ